MARHELHTQEHLQQLAAVGSLIPTDAAESLAHLIAQR